MMEYNEYILAPGSQTFKLDKIANPPNYMKAVSHTGPLFTKR